MAEVIINVENLTLKREPWRTGWVEAEGIVSHPGFVVRCRDCKHYYEADNYHPNGNYVRRSCKYFDTYDDEVEPDGFCAWGERRRDDGGANREDYPSLARLTS